MTRKLFEAYVKECEVHNSYVQSGAIDDIMISNQRMNALQVAYDHAGLYLEIIRNGSDLITSVSMYHDGDLLEVCETLWDGR